MTNAAPDPFLEKVDRSETLTRRQKLYFHHPDTSPLDFPGPLSGLIDPPSRTASSAKLRDFRACMAQLAADRPHDPNWLAFVAQIDLALAWRAEIDPADRFWKPDP